MINRAEPQFRTYGTKHTICGKENDRYFRRSDETER